MALSTDDRRKRASFFITRLNTSVPTGNTIELLLRPNGETIALKLVATIASLAQLQILEGAVLTSDGTPVTPQAKDRTDKLVSNVSAFRSPVVDRQALMLFNTLVREERSAQLVLDPTIDYVIRLTNLATAAQPMSLELAWREA